jgi:hypothetical protein
MIRAALVRIIDQPSQGSSNNGVVRVAATLWFQSRQSYGYTDKKISAVAWRLVTASLLFPRVFRAAFRVEV